MSEDYYIGLSRKQIEALLRGEEVGKRPYDNTDNPNNIYNGCVRIHIKMLPESVFSLSPKIKKEPESAFNW